MKYILTLILVISLAVKSNAQTGDGTTQNTGQKGQQINKQEKKRLQRGTGQYHSNKDTTPGSPMGTGGTGGDMSGSPAGSAIETDDQTSKVEAGTDSTSTTVDSSATTSGEAGKKSSNK